MIELRSRGWPPDDIEVFSVMLGVAPHTVGVHFGTVHYASVVACVPGDKVADVAVTRQALKLG
jgi:hypothetical protein